MVTDLDSQVNPGRVIPANCPELAERGKTEDGVYLIQPSIEVSPFEVTCQFGANETRTIVAHDQPGKQITSTPGKPDGCQG